MSFMIPSSRRPIDILHPDLSRIDVRRDIALPLARAARFAGHMGAHAGEDRIWSVAQHCVVGAKALVEETGDLRLGLLFVLHDAHEGLIGDKTTPTMTTLGEMMSGGARAEFRTAVRQLKRGLDREIWRLAGIVPTDRELAVVHLMDMRMLATEARQILGVDPAARPDLWSREAIEARPVKTHGALTPWRIKRAADEWMALWEAWRIRPAAHTCAA